MNKSPRKILTRSFIVAAFFGLSICTEIYWGESMLSAATARPSQSVGYKLVEVGPQTRLNAVMITKVTVATEEIQCGLMVGPRSVQPVAPFQAGPNWLKNMIIYLYNRTDKNIAFIDMPLGFPETGNGRTEPQSIYHIKLGRIPAADAFFGRTGQLIPIDPRLEPLKFRPNATLAVNVGDYIDKIRTYVEERMLLSGVTKLVIHGGTVFFDDGMRWRAGAGYSVPNAQHLGRFDPLDRNYFPGVKYRNWPPARDR